MEELLKLLASNPESLTGVIKHYIAKYKSVGYVLAQELVEICKDYSNNTEYPAIVAKAKKNMYDAYVAAGFTEEQAMALMINDNIQLMKNMKRVTTSNRKVD